MALWSFSARVEVCGASLLAHVEEAEAGKVVSDQQLLLNKLLFDLTELYDAHAAAIGSQFAGGVLFEADKQVFRRCCPECGKELFFENGEMALQIFKVNRRRRGGELGRGSARYVAADGFRKFAKADGGCGAGFGGDGRAVERGGGGFKMGSNVAVLEAGLSGII